MKKYCVLNNLYANIIRTYRPRRWQEPLRGIIPSTLCTFLPLSSYQEDCRNLTQIRHARTLPFADGAGMYPFVGGGYTSRYAHTGIWTQ